MAAAIDNQNPPALTARQQQRMLHHLLRYRELLASDPVIRGRERAALDALIAEVQPIIWPQPVVPPGLRDRNGNVR